VINIHKENNKKKIKLNNKKIKYIYKYINSKIKEKFILIIDEWDYIIGNNKFHMKNKNNIYFFLEEFK